MTAGFTTFRIVGIVVTGLYFALTLVNAWTRGGLLDSLYEEPAVKWKEQVDEYKRQLEESARLSAKSK